MKKIVIRPFLVFNGEYEDTTMNREGVINTSVLMEETLFNTEYLHYDINKAVVIKNGSRTDVFRQLRAFVGTIDLDNEMFLFYFCGHGCPDYRTNKLYLAMKDTDFDHVSDNGIESQKINEIMAEYHIKYYAIILDCCHAGMHSLGSNDEPVYSISISDYTDSKGAFFIPTIEASRSVQTMDFGGKNYVPFSFYFFKTLQEGIINEYKRISFKELYDIVKQRLEEIDIKLPPVDQKGELYNVAIWENLKYRNVGNGYISDEEENLQRIKEFKVKEQFADLYGALKDVLDFINMLEVLIAYPDSMQDDRHKRFNELKNNIMSVIFAAGSKEAVELMSYIREAIYEGLDDGKTISTRLLIAAHILLAMQLKYDVTGIETSPKEWYAGKYTTQKMEKTNFYNEAKEINNNIVDKLRLESFLRIED